MKKIIDYGNESVDITQKCCESLIENNFRLNSEQTNIQLLEENLINYSLLKLYDWGIDIDNLKIEQWSSLASILQALNNLIPSLEGREGFFAQYTHCIIYTYSRIIKQEPITWTKLVATDIPYDYKLENGIIKSLKTSKIVPPHEIPINLLEQIKTLHIEKKNPIIKK